MQQYHLQNRPEREIKEDSEIREILERGKYVVVAMCRENEPYIVTLSYGYDRERNCLYAHVATKGLKLDFIKANPRVCATVIEDGGYVRGECEHKFRTVVFWGTMEAVTTAEEKRHGLRVLLEHLEKKPAVVEAKLLKGEASFARMEILRLKVDRISGKAGK